MTTAAPTPPTTMPTELRRYLSAPCLTPLWAATRARLERNRLSIRGAVTIALDEDGADRLSGLLGTAITAGRLRIRLDFLDAVLRQSSAACGLVSALEQLSSTPLVDRSAARDTTRNQRALTWTDLDATLATAGLADAPWVPTFIDSLRKSGMLTRAGTAAAPAVRDAGAVLAELRSALRVGDGGPEVFATPAWELGELASRCTGTAHGLDDGSVAAALVLRAGAAALGLPPAETSAQRRELWEHLGVATDVVSGTVLAWALTPAGDAPWAAMMRQRADLGLVTHLSVHELRAVAGGQDLVPPGAVVFACENPQVLQAAAHAGVNRPLLCLSGNPANAGWLLVRRLLAAGVVVRYHGDFDWPGVAIAGRLFVAGASPWRFDALSYRAAVAERASTATLALAGSPGATPWDPDLAVAMSQLNVAVHEESVLDDLLRDLKADVDHPG